MEERAYWLAWSRIPGIGSVLLKRLQQQFENLKDAWEASPEDLRIVEGIGPQILETIVSNRKTCQPLDLLATHQQDNPDFWLPLDADYPRLLAEIPSYPPILYYRGQAQETENQGITPMVAIVGTRNPSDYGKRWTRKLTKTLVDRGFTIVSGLAEGIDTEAHQSCLEAGGRTIAVLGTGVDQVYPWRNRSLYQQILKTGLVVSEYPQGTKPDRLHFPQRNRIIAGLCRAVIVTEAPEKSGALITAHVANDYNRDVYVLPGSLDNPAAAGCLKLINKGAQIILGENHLLELLGQMPALDPSSQAVQLSVLPDLESPLAEIFQVVQAEPVHLDGIVQKTGLPASTVSSSLTLLEMMGLVTQIPGMRYQRC